MKNALSALLLLALAGIAFAAPAPFVLMANDATGECVVHWPGDEFASYMAPQGFYSIAFEHENPHACYEYKCNTSGGVWVQGKEECECTTPGMNSMVYGCLSPMEQQIDEAASERICENSGGTWSSLSHYCDCPSQGGVDGWYYSQTGCPQSSGNGGNGGDDGLLCCCCPSGFVLLPLLFILIPLMIMRDERGE